MAAFGTWPALVFLRRGEYLGVITQVQNWDDYLREIRYLLDSEPTRTPGLSFNLDIVDHLWHAFHDVFPPEYRRSESHEF